MWSWNRRNLPKINYGENSSSSGEEDNFKSPEGPPAGSPSNEAARVELWEDFRPDTQEILEAAAEALTPIANRRARRRQTLDQEIQPTGSSADHSPRRSFTPPPEAPGSSAEHSPRRALTPPPVQPKTNKMVNYDMEDKEDGEDYYMRIGLLKLEWDPDVRYWFNSIEASLRHAQVFKQWTKREIIQNLLPAHVREEVKYLLRLSQDEAGDTPYKDIKDAIIEIFDQKPQDAMDRALSRTLTSRPSTLAKQLINDLCTCRPALNCQCCANQIFGLFRRQLPTAVRNAIADQPFNKETYKKVLTLADKVFESNKPDAFGASTVASVTQDTPQTGEVAAVRGGSNRGRGGGRGGRNRGGGQASSSNSQTQNQSNRGGTNSRGRGRGGQSGPPKGPKHPDGPPDGSCQIHHSFGRSATFCRRPLTCPWKDIIASD